MNAIKVVIVGLLILIGMAGCRTIDKESRYSMRIMESEHKDEIVSQYESRVENTDLPLFRDNTFFFGDESLSLLEYSKQGGITSYLSSKRVALDDGDAMLPKTHYIDQKNRMRPIDGYHEVMNQLNTSNPYDLDYNDYWIAYRITEHTNLTIINRETNESVIVEETISWFRVFKDGVIYQKNKERVGVYIWEEGKEKRILSHLAVDAFIYNHELYYIDIDQYMYKLEGDNIIQLTDNKICASVFFEEHGMIAVQDENVNLIYRLHEGALEFVNVTPFSTSHYPQFYSDGDEFYYSYSMGLSSDVEGVSIGGKDAGYYGEVVFENDNYLMTTHYIPGDSAYNSILLWFEKDGTESDCQVSLINSWKIQNLLNIEVFESGLYIYMTGPQGGVHFIDFKSNGITEVYDSQQYMIWAKNKEHNMYVATNRKGMDSYTEDVIQRDNLIILPSYDVLRVTETGMFYIYKEKSIYYYDFKSNESFLLDTRNNNRSSVQCDYNNESYYSYTDDKGIRKVIAYSNGQVIELVEESLWSVLDNGQVKFRLDYDNRLIGVYSNYYERISLKSVTKESVNLDSVHWMATQVDEWVYYIDEIDIEVLKYNMMTGEYVTVELSSDFDEIDSIIKKPYGNETRIYIYARSKGSQQFQAHLIGVE